MRIVSIGTTTKSTRIKRVQTPAPVECWHKCPTHAALYPAWASLSDADQIEIGVMWRHPVGNLTKLDQYEKPCPECRSKTRGK